MQTNVRKKEIILLILIIFLQVILRLWVGCQKQYFHMDEAYSYGLMNYNRLNITDNEDFLGNWHNKDYYLDYLEVNREDIGKIRCCL